MLKEKVKVVLKKRSLKLPKSTYIYKEYFIAESISTTNKEKLDLK